MVLNPVRIHAVLEHLENRFYFLSNSCKSSFFAQYIVQSISLGLQSVGLGILSIIDQSSLDMLLSFFNHAQSISILHSKKTSSKQISWYLPFSHFNAVCIYLMDIGCQFQKSQWRSHSIWRNPSIRY